LESDNIENVSEALQDVTRLLARWRDGNAEALNQLIPIVYKELRRTADRYLRQERPNHTLQPTALVHETYLRLARVQNVQWESRTHFFAAAAQIMRHLLINYALARKAEKRGEGCRITLNEDIGAPRNQTWDIESLHDALNKLAALDERKARIVELRLFTGLSNQEIAEVLGISLTTVNTDWRAAKAWLFLKLRKARKHAEGRQRR
jgi:RNA polymerase sigma factor (TIGR02999 family)